MGRSLHGKDGSSDGEVQRVLALRQAHVEGGHSGIVPLLALEINSAIIEAVNALMCSSGQTSDGILGHAGQPGICQGACQSRCSDKR